MRIRVDGVDSLELAAGDTDQDVDISGLALVIGQQLTAVQRPRLSAMNWQRRWSQLYPAFAQKLVELLPRIAANDREIAYINGHALPSGAKRLLVAELKARGLPWVMNSIETPRITDQLYLPPW